jgi:RNA polymerase sigma-70 factor, ECF subfamily
MTGKTELSEMDRYAVDCIESRVRYLIGKYGLTTDDRADLVQQLFLEYLERIGDYDPARSTYKTFVACLIRNRVTSLI